MIVQNDTDDGIMSTALPANSSAIGKAVAVLSVLRNSRGPMTLTAIAEAIGVAPSSAHSILSHLLKESMVLQLQDKRYELGPQLFYLGAGYAGSTAVYRATWMELVDAASELGVTSAVAVQWEDGFLVLNSHRSGRANVAMPFAGRVPLDASSWGKVYFAWSGAKLPTKLTRYTGASITNPKAYAEEIQLTRQRGYATDRGEFHEGVGGVCAPVTSNAGFEGLATFVVPLDRLQDADCERLGQALVAITARASLTLGDVGQVKFFGSA